MRRPDLAGLSGKIGMLLVPRRVPTNPFLGLVVHVAWDYHREKGAHGSLADYAQEKPERDEQPERAPAGMGVPFAG